MTQTPDFSLIDYDDFAFKTVSYEQWRELVEAATGKSPEEFVWETNEQLAVKMLYTDLDTASLEHLGFMSGIPPFLRGPYPRQAGFSRFWRCPCSRPLERKAGIGLCRHCPP